MIIGLICFLLFAILTVRSLLLLFAEQKPLSVRFFDFLAFLFFGACAAILYLFLGIRFSSHLIRVAIVFVILALPFVVFLNIRLRKPYRPRPFLLILKVVLLLFLLLASVFSLMSSGFLYLIEDQPVLKITMTGKTKAEVVEWKPPAGTMQRESLTAYEVKFSSPEGSEIAGTYLYGDQVAVKAKILRFRPIFNAMGLRNLYRIEYIYNGYNTAERHNALPHKAVELPLTDPRLLPIQQSFWSFWEEFYYQRSQNWWVKSATLESNYFPLIDQNGRPFSGSYYLTVTTGGLSSVPLP